MAEVHREAATTRRVLDRVPENKMSWTPHPKSMSLGTLALHVATISGALAELLREPVPEAPDFSRGRPQAGSREELLSALETSVV